MYNMVYKTDVGEMAPDFTLPSSRDRTVRLYDCKNKKAVVLFFFNHEDPRCMDRLSSLAGDYPQFKAQNAVIFPISIIPVSAGKQIAADRNLPFGLLCDSDHTVTWMYGVGQCSSEQQHVCFEVITHISDPQILVVDPSGIIRAKHKLYEPGQRPDNAQLLEECRAAFR
ncbi:MAG: thioredoxin-dependent thiol peroxidase [Methanocella sp. PtaU1.Bin125]|nr:MAG: thioredoxin-dependent thiol peroxidase [Methanocella sp. PtaU1.Bin125]